MVDLSNLNDEQKEAVVTTEGYVRVIASPGSGKTRALTHRFAYLIDDLKTSNKNILCITYTNKAADEMKERIIKLLNETNEVFENISTIHSYCDRFLRKYLNGLKYSISSSYTIYDDYDSEKIVGKIKANYSDLKELKVYEVLKLISDFKLENPNYIEYLFGLNEGFSSGEEWIDEVLKVCKNNNGFMFDDLIYGALYILNNNDSIREEEQNQYKYVLVDEFQDTTPNTYELVKILASKHNNLFIVGDPDQSIYEFIGAKPNILLNQFISDFPSAKTLVMNTNYRSTNQIIDLSNQLISNNKNRHSEKHTIPVESKDGSSVVYNHFDSKVNQNYNICRIIDHLHNTLKYDYKDIFLIARNNFSFTDLKKELIKNNIPYTNSRTTSKMNTREEIKLVTYYLTFALSENAFSLYNINDIVGLGIDEKEMEKVLNVSVKPYDFLQEHSNEKVIKFMESNERIKKVILSNDKKTSEIIEMVIGEYEILSRYSPDFNTGYFAEGERISDLIQSVVHNEKLNPNYSLYDFIDSMALDSSIETSKQEDGVRLMTAHGSKGLEAKNVIVFDYNSIPHNGAEIEGERRLSYVAFTRAKENLFILSAATKYRRSESMYASEFKGMCIGVEQYLQNMKLKPIEYNIEEEIKDLNDEKKEAFKILYSGKNVFLTGEAGTGKTYLINKYVEYLTKMDKKFLICAPTGIAASNYTGGKTINKAFNIPIVPSIISPFYPASCEGVSKMDVIIMDEISMCRIDIFEYIMRVVDKCLKYRETPIQVILCGDFFQLPPVILDTEKKLLKSLFLNFNEGFAFESEEWEKHNFVNICLKEVFRQKKGDFITALNKARRGIDVDEAIEFINNNCAKEPIRDAMEIHSRNSMVTQINNSKLSELHTKQYVYEAKYKGIVSGEVNVETTLILKPGCRVMMLANHPDLLYQNGSFATVLTCGENYVDVVLDKDKTLVRVYPKEFSFVDEPQLIEGGLIGQHEIGSVVQIPMKLAYAITIHKSQGQTYDKVNLDPQGWESGQIYVALSRIKNINGLFLYKKVDKEALKTSKQVISFYNEL